MKQKQKQAAKNSDPNFAKRIRGSRRRVAIEQEGIHVVIMPSKRHSDKRKEASRKACRCKVDLSDF